MSSTPLSAGAAVPHHAWLGEFILLASLWGASFLFMRLGAAEFGPLPTAGLRVLLATLFLWPILLHRGEWPQLRRHWRPVLLCGLIISGFFTGAVVAAAMNAQSERLVARLAQAAASGPTPATPEAPSAVSAD